MHILKTALIPLLLTQLMACSGNSDDKPAQSATGSGGTSASGGAGPAAGGVALASGGALSGLAGSSGTFAMAGTGNTDNSGVGGSAFGGSSAGGATGGSAADGAPSGGAGGRSASGGAGGMVELGGSAGSGPGIPNCTTLPVTPNATAATRKVLCYLLSIYGNHILSSQEEDNSDAGMNTVVAATGKYPAVRAFDVNNTMAPTQCAQHWQQRGGLCMFGYHMGINGGTFSTPTNINNVLQAGTAENRSFNADLDRFAQYIQPLKAAGGVAIVRLFHEAGKGCSWFWWSMGTSDQYKSLYKYAFNYLTGTKALNNLLWVVPMCGNPDPAFDPGAQFSDFGGADTYVTDTGPLTSLANQTVSSFPNRAPMLHE